jgi:hypothetical protein
MEFLNNCDSSTMLKTGFIFSGYGAKYHRPLHPVNGQRTEVKWVGASFGPYQFLHRNN